MDFITPIPKMLYGMPYPNFMPPHSKQRKNKNWADTYPPPDSL